MHEYCLCMSTVYAWPYLKQPWQSTTIHIFALLVSGSLVEAQIRIRMPRVFQLQSFSLRVANAALWQSGPPLAFTCFMHDIDLREIFECTHLKFTVSGRSKQASKHTHTRAQCSHASVGLAQPRSNNGQFIEHKCLICHRILYILYTNDHIWLVYVHTYTYTSLIRSFGSLYSGG